MAALRKTRQVEQDLIDIWLYTAEKWGEAQADKYLRALETRFEEISRGAVPLKILAEAIRYVRCEHHFIFVLAGKKPVVVTVLHEKMDLLTRLKKRLD
ncbi:MAG: type II toxin-antitoxin system RelE/ParE family toxin [Alphaproteobacteria bacterium]|nr:type II toxin-antitoxin system RelE/ParE family toxin [Alphaproteobacteria bacterium]